jgi:hypothetical protein
MSEVIEILKPRTVPLAAIRQLAADKPSRYDGDYPNSSVANSADDEWDLSVGYDGAADLLAKGWPEGVSKMREMQAHSKPVGFDVVQRWSLDYAGSRPCVPAFLGGDMRTMWRRGSETSPRQLLRVAFNVNASALYSGDQLLGRAIAYCELVQQLESTGVDVEVWIFTLSYVRTSEKSKTGRLLPVYSLIKPAGQHVQPDIFLVTLGHPAFYRRCFFRVYESQYCKDAFTKHPYPVGYGHPVIPKLYPDALASGLQHYSILPAFLEEARALLQENQPIEGKSSCNI